MILCSILIHCHLPVHILQQREQRQQLHHRLLHLRRRLPWRRRIHRLTGLRIRRMIDLRIHRLRVQLRQLRLRILQLIVHHSLNHLLVRMQLHRILQRTNVENQKSFPRWGHFCSIGGRARKVFRSEISIQKTFSNLIQLNQLIVFSLPVRRIRNFHQRMHHRHILRLIHQQMRLRNLRMKLRHRNQNLHWMSSGL